MSDVAAIAGEFLAVWPIVFAFDFGRYAVTAGAVALGLHLLAGRLAARRVRDSDPPAGQWRPEILASLRTVLLFSFTGFAIHLGIRHGLLMNYPDIADHGWPWFAASVLLSIAAQDAWFYWTHRAMHHPRLFRLFHRTHHRSVRPTPWTAYAFDVPEALVQAAFLPLFLLAVPMHDLAIFLFLTHMIVRNVLGHCGYELMPRGLADSRAWGWINSVTHHDLHHESFRWNYGLYFTWWDRWMGTEHPNYRERLRRRPESGAAHRPSAAAFVAAAVSSVGLVCTDIEAKEPTAPSDALYGEWATQGYSAKVRIEPCEGEAGAGHACGYIVWLWEPADEAGKPKTDTRNPEPSLRDRPLAGVRILAGFKRGAGGEWPGGSIYNPEDGRTYAASLRIGPGGELRLLGCALSIFCQTQIWRRSADVCR